MDNQEVSMFEKEFSDMMASVFLSEGLSNTLSASNVGLGNLGLVPGFNHISSSRAIELIRKFDRMIPGCPKYLQKRIKAFRNSISFAFSPEMETQVKMNTEAGQ